MRDKKKICSKQHLNYSISSSKELTSVINDKFVIIHAEILCNLEVLYRIIRKLNNPVNLNSKILHFAIDGMYIHNYV